MQCWEIGQTEAVRFLLPWALLAASVRSEDISRAGRIERIEVSFTMMWAQIPHLPETGATKGLAERKTTDSEGTELPLTMVTRQQLKRGMNLCIDARYDRRSRRAGSSGLSLL
jgi:hypothetical protein